MRKRLLSAALLSLALSFAAAAQTPTHTISHTRGSASGGTQVTIVGPFAHVTTSVYFGGTPAPATRVNDTTLQVTTPAHLPGTVQVTLWVFGQLVNTGLTFTFDNDADEAFARLLLPVYTLPVPGAFGSEFRTEFRATLANGESVEIYGLSRHCVVLCIEPPGSPHRLFTQAPDLDQNSIQPNGTPGQFIYVPREQLGRVAMNLRAYDTSRSAENFGTEIPIVRDEEFANQFVLKLVGIPTDARFRNTLRIYSAGDGGPVSIDIRGVNHHSQHAVFLPPQDGLTHPGYVQFTNFPVNAGIVSVTLNGVTPIQSPPLPNVNYWAFVSVTNNVTQHFTTITPQPRRSDQ